MIYWKKVIIFIVGNKKGSNIAEKRLKTLWNIILIGILEKTGFIASQDILQYNKFKQIVQIPWTIYTLLWLNCNLRHNQIFTLPSLLWDFLHQMWKDI